MFVALPRLDDVKYTLSQSQAFSYKRKQDLVLFVLTLEEPTGVSWGIKNFSVVETTLKLR